MNKINCNKYSRKVFPFKMLQKHPASIAMLKVSQTADFADVATLFLSRLTFLGCVFSSNRGI